MLLCWVSYAARNKKAFYAERHGTLGSYAQEFIFYETYDLA